MNSAKNLLAVSYTFEETPSPGKRTFMDLDERVKLRLFQALTKDARPDSNSRPTVQISNFWPFLTLCTRYS
jgi:hypothetical protein